MVLIALKRLKTFNLQPLYMDVYSTFRNKSQKYLLIWKIIRTFAAS